MDFIIMLTILQKDVYRNVLLQATVIISHGHAYLDAPGHFMVKIILECA